MQKNEELKSHHSRVFIGLGSNIEPRLEYLRKAVRALSEIGEIVKISSTYETLPVGGVPQPDYLNAAAELNTILNPLDLVHHLKAIESRLGRIERPRWHEREIDLDLLFYDNLVMNLQELTIPHPELHKRAFVIMPLMEIAQAFVHPILKRSISDILEDIETDGIRRTKLKL